MNLTLPLQAPLAFVLRVDSFSLACLVTILTIQVIGLRRESPAWGKTLTAQLPLLLVALAGSSTALMVACMVGLASNQRAWLLPLLGSLGPVIVDQHSPTLWGDSRSSLLISVSMLLEYSLACRGRPYAAVLLVSQHHLLARIGQYTAVPLGVLLGVLLVLPCHVLDARTSLRWLLFIPRDCNTSNTRCGMFCHRGFLSNLKKVSGGIPGELRSLVLNRYPCAGGFLAEALPGPVASCGHYDPA